MELAAITSADGTDILSNYLLQKGECRSDVFLFVGLGLDSRTVCFTSTDASPILSSSIIQHD
jgi:hypothetical protein